MHTTFLIKGKKDEQSLPCVFERSSPEHGHLHEQSKCNHISKLMSQENEPWLFFHFLTSNITFVFIVNIKTTTLS